MERVAKTHSTGRDSVWNQFITTQQYSKYIQPDLINCLFVLGLFNSMTSNEYPNVPQSIETSNPMASRNKRESLTHSVARILDPTTNYAPWKSHKMSRSHNITAPHKVAAVVRCEYQRQRNKNIIEYLRIKWLRPPTPTWAS